MKWALRRFYMKWAFGLECIRARKFEVRVLLFHVSKDLCSRISTCLLSHAYRLLRLMNVYRHTRTRIHTYTCTHRNRWDSQYLCRQYLMNKFISYSEQFNHENIQMSNEEKRKNEKKMKDRGWYERVRYTGILSAPLASCIILRKSI